MRALVTGGTGRVGSAIATRLETEGWNVFAAGRVHGDIASASRARAIVQHAVESLGGLDLLVNAAGEGFVVKPIEEFEEADFHRAFGATVLGSFFASQAAAAHLRETRGLIVMIEDVAGYLPWANLTPHCVAKAGQAQLTRIFARALAPEVRVCGIAPGPVAVPADHAEGRAARTLLERVGEPEDIADAVSYLTRADYVTGTTLVVDGGRMLKTIAPGP